MTLKFILTELREIVFRAECLERELQNDGPNIVERLRDTNANPSHSLFRETAYETLGRPIVCVDERRGEDSMDAVDTRGETLPCPKEMQNNMTDEQRARAPEGLRFNNDKLGMDLLPPEVAVAWSLVATVGAKKYAPRNWEKGMSWMTLVGCAMRHQFKWLMGEDLDKETGLHHVDMWLWNVGALATYIKRGIGTDDRPVTAKWPKGI